MTEVIISHNGTIDEFTGDGILVFFGAPRALPDHTGRAVACALEMQEALRDLNGSNTDNGLPELGMGIGINCGELVVGHIGSEKRRKYGAVGSPINVAFRVEAQAKVNEILVTDEVYRRLSGSLIIASERNTALNGIEKPGALRRVVGLKEA